MTATFPHEYTVRVDGMGPADLRAGERDPIVGGAPPEFGGEGGWWSPEHLLVASAALCLATTFRVIAARARLEVRGYRTSARGTLDRTPDGLRFTRIDLDVELDVDDAERTRAAGLLGKAKQHCIVSNSLAAPVHVEVRAPALA